MQIDRATIILFSSLCQLEYIAIRIHFVYRTLAYLKYATIFNYCICGHYVLNLFCPFLFLSKYALQCMKLQENIRND